MALKKIKTDSITDDAITAVKLHDDIYLSTGSFKVPSGTTAQRGTTATGALRFNSTTSGFEGYDGTEWGTIGGGGGENAYTKETFTATANQTTFTLANAYTPGYIEVYLNGVKLISGDDFTATSSSAPYTVVLTTGVAVGNVVQTVAFNTFVVNVAEDTMITETFTATANQTTFALATAYTAGFINVYLNGIKLVVGVDVTASNGTTVVLIAGADVGDTLQTEAFSTFSSSNTVPSTGGSFTGAVTLPSPVINTGITGSAILDEDAMGSNSATKLATQQSIKAYVDAQTQLSLIDEDSFATDSATRPPSQQSVKAYVDAQILTEDTISELNDTTITGTPADNEVLAYDTGSSKWINQTASEAGLIPSSDLIDEDSMATDSATRPPSQQSVKAYVDTTVAATNELFEDSTPQLGGSLDVLAQHITTSTTNGHIRFDKGITEKIGTSTVGTTVVTVDLSTGNFFLMDLEALSGDVVTFTISNPNATANQVNNFVVKIIQGTTTTTRNFTWASIVTNGTNIDWAGGAGPDITTGADKVDILSFTSYDNGTTWYGAIVGQEFS